MCRCAGRSGVRRRQAWALMKVPPQQILAILAAVGTAEFSGAPHKPNSGGAARLPSPDRALAPWGWAEPGFLGEHGAGPRLRFWGPAHPAPHLHISAEAAAGADPILPKSTLSPLGLPHEPPNGNFESRCGEVHVFPVGGLERVRAPLPKGQTE